MQLVGDEYSTENMYVLHASEIGNFGTLLHGKNFLPSYLQAFERKNRTASRNFLQ